MDNSFQSTGQPKWDAQGLASKYELTYDSSLDDVLGAIRSDAYGLLTPEEGDAPLRRVWGTELIADLRAIVAAANRIRDTELSNFGGSVELACADLYGTKNVRRVMRAIYSVHLLPERDTPLKSDAAIVELLVTTLAETWNRLGGKGDATHFLSFARDALAGRWHIKPDLLWHAVGVAAISLGLHDE